MSRSAPPSRPLRLLVAAGFALAACGSETPPPGPGGEGVVGPSGGTLTFADGAVRLDFPPGAVSSDVEVTARPVSGGGPGLVVPGTAFDLGPSGLTFDAPVTLTLSYDPANVPAGVRETELGIHRIVGTRAEAVHGSSVRPVASNASAPLASFSVYAVGGAAVTTVRVEPRAVGLDVGASAQLTATGVSAEGVDLPDRPVTWASSDPDVATVDPTGLVSGVSPGGATISATIEGATGTAGVTVGGEAPLSFALDFATYFGGGAFEESREPVFFPDGRVLFGLRTYSPGMPATPGAIQSSFGGGAGDTFVAILTPDGSALTAGTYLGGSGQERPPYGMALTTDGDIVLTSGTDSPNFPVTAGAHHTTLGAPSTSGYACRLSADLTTRRWCTYVRGWPRGGLALTPEDDVLITGTIQPNTGFQPSAGAFQTVVRGVDDVFLLKLRGDGTGSVFATAVGGTGSLAGEVGLSVNVHGQEIYVGGIAGSADFPTTAGGPSPTGRGGRDGFLVRFNADGTALNYGTLLGGGGEDEAKHRNEVLADGAVLLGGLTFSPDFLGASGSLSGPSDAWVGVLDAAGSGFEFLRYLGGSGSDHAVDRAVDAQGRLYVVGSTSSADFPTTAGALQPTYGGAGDGFFTVFDRSGTLLYSTYLGGSGPDHVRGVEVGPSGEIVLVGGTSSDDFPATAGAYQTSRGGDEDGFVVKLVVSGG